MIELIKIEMCEAYEDSDAWENPGGSVYLNAFGTTGEVIIHACGELDFEGFEGLTDHQLDQVMNFMYENEEVNKAFPADEFP